MMSMIEKTNDFYCHFLFLYLIPNWEEIENYSKKFKIEIQCQTKPPYKTVDTLPQLSKKYFKTVCHSLSGFILVIGFEFVQSRRSDIFDLSDARAVSTHLAPGKRKHSNAISRLTTYNQLCL